MKKHIIRNTFFGLLTFALVAGTATDALAQRKVLRSERRTDEQHTERTTVKKNKTLKHSEKQKVHKDRTSDQDRSKTTYTKKENRKKDYRESRKDRKSYQRDKYQVGKHRKQDRHYTPNQTWHWRNYRKPSWADYHRPNYRYPRIGLHVPVLPHGYISFRIGKLQFYSYHGVYYRYDPALRVYIVVNKPAIETWYTSETWDRITLMDGSTIEGVYRYGDNESVLFEVGDALLEIPMSEIKVLSFSQH